MSRSVLQRIHWQWRLLPYQSKDDICVFKASITFIDAVSEIFSSLLSGHTLIVFPTQLVKDVSKFVKGEIAILIEMDKKDILNYNMIQLLIYCSLFSFGR